MKKLPKDPGLTEFAAQLRTLPWITPLSDEEARDLYHAATIPSHEVGAKRSHVYPMPNFLDWSVRIYLGGEQRTIGLVKTKDLANGLRFADMAMTYFWKYRVRGAAPPTAMQLNRLPENVAVDMVNETYALHLLKGIEAYLFSTHVLKTPAQLIEARRARRSKGGFRGLLVQSQIEVMEKFESVLAELEVTRGEATAAKEDCKLNGEVLVALKESLTEMKETQRLMIEALQGIAKMVAQLKEARP